MALSWRLGIMAAVLAIAVAAIPNISFVIQVLIAIAVFGMFLIATYLKSKPGRIVLIFVLFGAVILIVSNSFSSGVRVGNVDPDSEAAQLGIDQGSIITSLDGTEIESVEDYSQIVGNKFESNENETVRLDMVVDGNDIIYLSNSPPALTVTEISRSNLQTGLDVSGGARALVQPETEISAQDLDELIQISRTRLNAFGISDVGVRSVTDLSGNHFMLVEVAGATPTDLEQLLARQGKFEARIGNETVFIGGERDITDVCRNNAQCAAVTGCQQTAGGYACRFQFTVTLKPEAAQRHADITADVPIDPDSGGQYLSENLTLILDDQVVDELLIGTDLKGQVTTTIQIQGSGSGLTEEEAYDDALDSMNRLQTILRTGSLPFKLEIVKLDTVSPVLGSQFIPLIIIGGIGAILAVTVVVFIRYRKLNLSLALLLTAFSELLIILGIAALIRWNLDLPSIAGILAAVGTGVDQQIVILDEARSGRETNLSQRLKRALFILMAAYLTSLAALIPLFWAGAGLFRGFAITTIIGITAGVLITRPAFAKMIEKLTA